MSKQTAVEWLIESLIQYNIVPKGIHSDNVLFHKAKALEREQIINAWQKNPQGFNHTGQQYYQETYGGEK